MTAPDLAIAQALCAVIQPLTTSAGTSLVPVSTLTAASAVGATSVTLADASRFTAGGRFSFADGTGEETLRIDSISGNTVTLDFTGTGYTGLRYAHAGPVGQTPGATVTSNLFPTWPRFPDLGTMLAKGDPVIWAFVRAKQTPGKLVMGGAYPVYTVHLQYHRKLVQSNEDAPCDPALYSDRQETAARADLSTIWTALSRNPSLITGTAPAAVTALDTSGPFGFWAWDRAEAQTAGVEQFVAAMDIRYLGLQESFL